LSRGAGILFRGREPKISTIEKGLKSEVKGKHAWGKRKSKEKKEHSYIRKKKKRPRGRETEVVLPWGGGMEIEKGKV